MKYAWNLVRMTDKRSIFKGLGGKAEVKRPLGVLIENFNIFYFILFTLSELQCVILAHINAV
jgi:hypothetical protein